MRIINAQNVRGCDDQPQKEGLFRWFFGFYEVYPWGPNALMVSLEWAVYFRAVFFKTTECYSFKKGKEWIGIEQVFLRIHTNQLGNNHGIERKDFESRCSSIIPTI